MTYLSLLLVFISALTATLALLRLFSRQDTFERRLVDLEKRGREYESIDVSPRYSLKDTAMAIMAFFVPKAYLARIQNNLTAAGLPLKSEEYLAISVLVIIVVPILLLMVTQNTWLAIIAVIIGLFLPNFYVKNKKNARLMMFNQQLGDALVIMANSLRAGFGFQQAMQTVQRELPPPISTEFAWTLKEIQLGFSQEEALQNLTARIGSDNLEIVTTGIMIQRQVGGDLALILENIAETIRARATIKRQIKTLTAQGKMSGLVVGLLPLGLIGFMLVVNAGYFTVMVTDVRGIVMLTYCVISELLGIVFIHKIVDIEL